MRLYPVYLALLVLFIFLQLIYGNRSFADINLEEYDMSKVEVMDTPFWCSATPEERQEAINNLTDCLLYTSPSPRDPKTSRMPSSA